MRSLLYNYINNYISNNIKFCQDYYSVAVYVYIIYYVCFMLDASHNVFAFLLSSSNRVVIN